MKNIFVRPRPVPTLLALLVVLLMLLLSNYLALHKFNRLNQHISSIYNDRLLPASYLFNLHDQLYHQKMISPRQVGDQHYRERIQAIQDSMARVMKDYEATYLTRLEKEQWRYFRQSLDQFHQAQAQLMVGTTPDRSLSLELEREFYQANRYLSDLIALQLREGGALKDASQSLVGGSVIQSYLQISLVIILCVIGYALYRLYNVRRMQGGRHLYN